MNVVSNIFLLFFLCSQSFVCAQLTNYEYLLCNGKTECIHERRIDFDSLGNSKDTILEFSFYYNSEGFLIEKRCDFNTDYSKYSSYQYNYEKNGMKRIKTEIYNNPYILMGGEFEKTPNSKCEILNNYGNPVNTVLMYDEKTETWLFEYDGYCLLNKKIYFDGELKKVYLIEYVKNENTD